ncbi:NAD+ diphosphatase [Sphingomonas zeicaulis]|uniref:NAD(+) diphosphatase n=1 Tax=Sphingomonas zeicaulis TaxID=1632740 RepID=UPI003D2612E5
MRPAPGFTGATLDRGDNLRADPAAIAALAADPAARLLRLDGIDPVLDETGRLVWGGMDEVAEGADLILLGLADGRAHFVQHVPGALDAATRSAWIFKAIELMAPGDAALYGGARSLIDWHDRHGFCARCGQPTLMQRAGWGRRCPACTAEHFPRVDPVVIMLAEHEDRVLVGRQPRFPPRRYSALAGFVEPGEALEEAVARELWEEAGIRVRDVRYIASQPWPFPSSLMIACVATAEDDALTIDYTELEDAMWVPRAGVAASMAGEADAPFLPPPGYAIAHTLFRAWLGD